MNKIFLTILIVQLVVSSYFLEVNGSQQVMSLSPKNAAFLVKVKPFLLDKQKFFFLKFVYFILI